MASTMTATRGLGIQNARRILQLATSGTRRVGARDVTNNFNGVSLRNFSQTTTKRRGAGNTTAGWASRTGAGPQIGKTFFYARSIETPRTILQQIRARLFHSSRSRRTTPSPNPTAHLTSPKAENLTLGQRMRKLSREYGWAALGVYLALTAIDLPFCYLLVRTLGTDRIGRWEHIILDKIKMFIPESVKNTWHEWRASMQENKEAGASQVNQGVEMAGWGVEEAEESYKKDASLATQLALAYAIHKSFIFIRVPLTVSLTPKVVKVLRGWGWDIGKKTTKATKAANAAEFQAKKAEKAARKAQK